MGSRTSLVLVTAALLTACAPKAPALAPQPSAPTSAAMPQKGREGRGRLDPREIQRIVRASFPIFRACYEAGLGRDNHLHGKVVTKFVIAADDGTVSESTVTAASDLPDTVVLQCIQRGFKKLRFPTPEGGKVTVVYPIDFSLGD